MPGSVNAKWITAFGNTEGVEVNFCFGQLADPWRKPFEQTGILKTVKLMLERVITEEG